MFDSFPEEESPPFFSFFICYINLVYLINGMAPCRAKERRDKMNKLFSKFDFWNNIDGLISYLILMFNLILFCRYNLNGLRAFSEGYLSEVASSTNIFAGFLGYFLLDFFSRNKTIPLFGPFSGDSCNYEKEKLELRKIESNNDKDIISNFKKYAAFFAISYFVFMSLIEQF